MNPLENILMEPPSSSNISGIEDIDADSILNFPLTPSISFASGTNRLTGSIIPIFKKLITP